MVDKSVDRGDCYHLLLYRLSKNFNAMQEASNRWKFKTVRRVILQQLEMNNWEDAVNTFGTKVSCEALMPFTIHKVILSEIN